MAHTHEVFDTGKHFEINATSRFIKETSSTKLVLVQGDHRSEVVTFKMPRYIDGHDMLLCDKVRVHYINAETGSSNKSANIYEVTDLALCEDTEDILAFTWLIEAPATKYHGTLSFTVKFECTEGGNIVYQWSTAKYAGVNILEAIDNIEEFVEEYSNVLDNLINRVDELENNGVQGGSSSRISEVTLLASAWVGETSPYTQVVAIDGVTENSQVDLTPSDEQLEIFRQKELTLTTRNVGGVITVSAVGQKPQNDYTMQVTITEVAYE